MGYSLLTLLLRGVCIVQANGISWIRLSHEALQRDMRCKIKTKQLTKRRYGPGKDSSQYRATLLDKEEGVTTIPVREVQRKMSYRWNSVTGIIS